MYDGTSSFAPFESAALSAKREPELFSHRLWTKLDGFRLQVYASEHLIRVSMDAPFEAVLSINRRDFLRGTEPTNLVIPDSGFPVFARDDSDLESDVFGLLTKDRRAVALINRVILDHNDSLHMYRGGLVLYLFETASPERVLSVINDLLALTRMLGGRHVPKQPVELPKQFCDLQELASKWTISDDVERDDAITGASDDDLAALVRAVKPRLPEINSFLDRPDDTTDLGWLALSAVEAEQELVRRLGA